ncbi:MAG: class II fructose-bisphosphate aldolase, partial [Actinomycetes bacterium]
MSNLDPLGLVKKAQAQGYAVGAFNMHNPETTQALIRAAQQASAPVFLQVGRAIVPHMGLQAAFEMTRLELDRAEMQLPIHLDQRGPHAGYRERGAVQCVQDRRALAVIRSVPKVRPARLVVAEPRHRRHLEPLVRSRR